MMRGTGGVMFVIGLLVFFTEGKPNLHDYALKWVAQQTREIKCQRTMYREPRLPTTTRLRWVAGPSTLTDR